MKRARIPVAALVLVILAIAARAEAAPTMAFGYLVNKSRDANYDYLETIFPNSFANSLRNIFYVTIIKPAQIEQGARKGRPLAGEGVPAPRADGADGEDLGGLFHLRHLRRAAERPHQHIR